MNARPGAGFSLVELVVALTVFSLGILALVGAAAMTYRAFGAADALEQGVRSAALAMDSLLAEAEPQSGARLIGGVPVNWQVFDDTTALRIELEFTVVDGVNVRTTTLAALRLPGSP